MSRGTREILIDRRGTLRRAAVLTDGELTDLHIDRIDRPPLSGAVFLGRVARIAAGLDAAFVDIGTGAPGLLPAADVRPRARDARIGTLLRTGQPVLVQAKADSVGRKGALLTMDATLPGRFLVAAPFLDGITVSKRLGRGPERARLSALVRDAAPPGLGWIVRADAATADPGLVALEAEALAVAWRDAQRAAAGAAAPALLLPSPTAVARALVEQGGPGLTRIAVDGPEALAEVRAWCRDRAPDLERLARPHVDRVALFETGDLEQEISALMEPLVPLPDGGSLVIERTEALTAIDVNGGEKGNALATNLAAAREIARQLRLRNVGGIVVVDFINLDRAGEREQLIQALSGAVSEDPGNTHVYGMSRLGLVEMTRQRRGPALADLAGPLEP
ncbi:MAG TPA: ribonuclease E/G [Azospirillaceae bacterium]|nr:ribonuclease E/G [Azospirillaceae bacterium]